MTFKKFVCSFLAAAMLALTTGQTAFASQLKVGDYFRMGSYKEQPIIWRCVETDSNSALMLSDKVLCFMEYDAAGTADDYSHGRGYTRQGVMGANRQSYGSNYWGDSNIRMWLNSDCDSGGVDWLCGNTPSYNSEPGFLTGFKEKEREVMQELFQKSAISIYERATSNSDKADNGHTYNDSPSDVVQNYEEAYGEEFGDYMFLLNCVQANSLYKRLNSAFIAKPTAYAASTLSSASVDMACGYWLRDARGDNSFDYMVRIVADGGTILMSAANSGTVGIRPAFYLDLNKASLASGDGSAQSPYSMDAAYINGDANADYAITALDAAITLQKVMDNDYQFALGTLTSSWLQYLNVTGSGQLTAVDAAQIMQKVLDNTHKFPIEQ